MPMNKMDLIDNSEYKKGFEDGLRAGKTQQLIADEYRFNTTINTMYGTFVNYPPSAKWERPNPTTPKSYTRICSRCKRTAYVIGGTEYPRCPWCGAFMNGGDDDAQT